MRWSTDPPNFFLKLTFLPSVATQERIITKMFDHYPYIGTRARFSSEIHLCFRDLVIISKGIFLFVFFAYYDTIPGDLSAKLTAYVAVRIFTHVMDILFRLFKGYYPDPYLVAITLGRFILTLVIICTFDYRQYYANPQLAILISAVIVDFCFSVPILGATLPKYTGLSKIVHKLSGRLPNGIILSHFVSSPRAINASDPSCLICQQEYKEGELRTVLPCEHTFHQTCIMESFRDSRACPACGMVFGQSI